MGTFSLELDWIGQTWDWELPEMRLTERLETGETPYVREVVAEVVFPRTINTAALRLLGHDMEGSVARLLLDGDVHIQGRVHRPVYGGVGAQVRFAVREAPWDDTATYPPPHEISRTEVDDAASALASEAKTQAVNAALSERFPFIGPQTFDVDVVATRVIGLVYPTVFGAPGSAYSETAGATPGFVIDDGSVSSAPKILIAGHRVAASTVTLRGPSDTAGAPPVTESVSVSHTTDLLGREYAYVDISGTTLLEKTVAAEIAEADWSVIWDGGDGLSGGAYDVLRHMLKHSTVRKDWASLQGLRDWLNGFTLAGCIDEPVTPWEWVEKNLLPILPVRWAMGRDGFYLVPIYGGHRPISALIVEGPEAVLVGGADAELRTADVEVLNDYTLRYQRREDSRDYGAQVHVHANNCLHALLSRQRHGPSSRVETTDMVEGDATAARIAFETVMRHALRDIIWEMDLDADQFDHLRPGHGVRCTLPSWTLDGESDAQVDAQVLAVTYGMGERILVELGWEEDPTGG